MGTRAVYSFTDQYGSFFVYKHFDGYPSGGISAIRDALPFAWKSGRFEADDFAAAFIRGNKTEGGGDIRCMNICNPRSPESEFPGDIEYWYKVGRDDKGCAEVGIYKTPMGAPQNARLLGVALLDDWTPEMIERAERGESIATA